MKKQLFFFQIIQSIRTFVYSVKIYIDAENLYIVDHEGRCTFQINVQTNSNNHVFRNNSQMLIYLSIYSTNLLYIERHSCHCVINNKYIKKTF